MAQAAVAEKHGHQTEQADNRHTRRIAEFVSGLTYEKIPAEVRARIKLLILDSIGCGIYGAIKQHSQLDRLSKRVLEINGQHELTRRMAAMAVDEAGGLQFDELAKLLLDQARIVEGEPIPDPGAFSRRMSSFLAKGLVA